MTPPEPRRDPENTERTYLQPFHPESDQRVLDIGCGDGRLTWLLAQSAGFALGVDLDVAELRKAASTHPAAVSPKVSFVEAAGEAMPVMDESFDLAIFSWSL